MQKTRPSLILSIAKSVNRQTGALLLCLLVLHPFALLISSQKIAAKNVCPPVATSNCDTVGWHEVQNSADPEIPGTSRSQLQVDTIPIKEGNQSHYPIPLINGLRENRCMILRI